MGGQAVDGVGPHRDGRLDRLHAEPPPRLSDAAQPGAYDPVARLAMMDECGIYSQVLYPNIAGFGSGRFMALGEPGLMLACVRAYNDFLGEWAQIGGERFAPIMALPFWDLDASLREVERCVSLGHKGILFCGDPDRFGQPYLADPYWNPLWSLAQEAGLAVNFHVGNSDEVGPSVPTNPFTGSQTQIIKDESAIGDLPVATLRKILHDNAARIYHID